MSDLNVLPFKAGFDVDAVNLQNQLVLNQNIVKQIIADPLTIINPQIINVLEEATLEDYKAYLKSFQTTIWAHKSIGSARGLEEAAVWIKSTISNFIEFYSNSKG